MDVRDLWRLDATAQAELVQAREVTPLELADAAIARIEKLNPLINAVITPLFDRAREQAADPPWPSDAPFAGVPMLVKDACLEIEGTPYYLGTSVLRDVGCRSVHTTELAHRFQRAGFIVLGKTNTPELSSGITTELRAFGATHNPWDLDRSAGGSSGGSAAAVAAGMTAIAHGGDATGSLRYPAACCGVATLKPSRGRIPHVSPAGTPDALGVWTEFVLARSVRDLAGVLDTVCGVETGAAFTAPPPQQPYVRELAAPQSRLRIGIMTEDAMAKIPTHPECAAAVECTGRALASLGHDVEDTHPPALDGLFIRTASAIATFVASASHRQTAVRWLEAIAGRKLTQDDLEARFLDPDQKTYNDEEVAAAHATITREMSPMAEWWDIGHDLLVTPTLRQPAWPLGQTGGAADAGVFPPPWSFTGQPAMSLPLHWTPEGLPVGVQLVAAYGREDLLFRVAAQLEQAMPWAQRWPPVAS